VDTILGHLRTTRWASAESFFFEVVDEGERNNDDSVAQELARFGTWDRLHKEPNTTVTTEFNPATCHVGRELPALSCIWRG
jgi:hypothetical protein